MEYSELELLAKVTAIKPDITNPGTPGNLIWFPEMDKLEGRNLTIMGFSNPNEREVISVKVKETDFKFDANWLRLVSRPSVFDMVRENCKEQKTQSLLSFPNGISVGMLVLPFKPRNEPSSEKELKWLPGMLEGELLTIKKISYYNDHYVINMEENNFEYNVDWLTPFDKTPTNSKTQVNKTARIGDGVRLKKTSNDYEMPDYEMPHYRPRWLPEMSSLIENNTLMTICSLTYGLDRYGKFIRVHVRENSHEFDMEWLEIIQPPPKNGFTLIKAKYPKDDERDYVGYGCDSNYWGLD